MITRIIEILHFALGVLALAVGGNLIYAGVGGYLEGAPDEKVIPVSIGGLFFVLIGVMRILLSARATRRRG